MFRNKVIFDSKRDKFVLDVPLSCCRRSFVLHPLHVCLELVCVCEFVCKVFTVTGYGRRGGGYNFCRRVASRLREQPMPFAANHRFQKPHCLRLEKVTEKRKASVRGFVLNCSLKKEKSDVDFPELPGHRNHRRYRHHEHHQSIVGEVNSTRHEIER